MNDELTYGGFVVEFNAAFEIQCGYPSRMSEIYKSDANKARETILAQDDLDGVLNIVRMLDLKVPRRDMGVMMTDGFRTRSRSAPAIFDVVSVCLRALRMEPDELWPATGGPNQDYDEYVDDSEF